MMKKIILTGGGTAGHVTPNIALLPALREAGYEISYIGSRDGMERDLMKAQHVPYYGISSGKLRRYFDWKNFSDPFRVLHGIGQAKKILKKERPSVVFSKGGYVSVPVVYAAKSLHIPVIIHESDITPGLANKLCFKASYKVCCNFPETIPYLPEGKAVLTGSPIRRELLSGDPEEGRRFCGFDRLPGRAAMPVLMVTGGSLGSVRVNTSIRSILPRLLESFNVVHLCGKGNLDTSLNSRPGYVQFEYVSEQMADLFALADVVVSRAGANSICELLELRKPNLLIPLNAAASRGDQLLNARSFKKQGYSQVLEEEEITDDVLYNSIMDLYKNRRTYIDTMAKSKNSSAIEIILGLIEKASAGDVAGGRN